MLLPSVLPLLIVLIQASLASSSPESFHESLTLHPLPNGKLSVLFEFTTLFTSSRLLSTIREVSVCLHVVESEGYTAQSHHGLTPPSLLLPLEQNHVSELTISFVAGHWDQLRSGEAGALHYEAGGGGGEIRGWLRSGDGPRR